MKKQNIPHKKDLRGLDLLQTLQNIQPMILEGDKKKQEISSDAVSSAIQSIDADDKAIIHPLRELVKRVMHPGVPDLAPGWKISPPTLEGGYEVMSIRFGGVRTGSVTERAKIHARPCLAMSEAYDKVKKDCVVEVNNGSVEFGWQPLTITSAIDAANTGELAFMRIRAKDRKSGLSHSKTFLEEAVVPLVQRESWEDLMQTHGILIPRNRDLFRDAELFEAAGTETGIVLKGRLIYAENFESPPASTLKIPEEELDGEKKKLEAAVDRAVDMIKVKGVGGVKSDRMVLKAQKKFIDEVGDAAVDRIVQPVDDTMSMLTGSSNMYPNAEMAVELVVRERIRNLEEGGQEGHAAIVQTYKETRDIILDNLRGGSIFLKWNQFTKGLAHNFKYILLTEKRLNTTEVGILKRVGFLAATTPEEAEGKAGHLFAAGKSDLFPVLMGLYGMNRANGYDILKMVKESERGIDCLLLDHHHSEGGPGLILDPEPRLLDTFGVSGGNWVRYPFKKYDHAPIDATADGRPVNIRFNMDTLDHDVVSIAAGLGMKGTGLARLCFELRYLGDGWEFTPGEAKHRTTLKRYLSGRITEAVKCWESHAFPENRDEIFLLRIPDLRPKDPNKMPYVFRKFISDSNSVSSQFMLDHKDDLFVPTVDAIREAHAATKHPIAVLLPDVKNAKMYAELKQVVGGELMMIPQIESREGIKNMGDMTDAQAFSIGVNDLTQDVTGLARGDKRYDSLDGRVLAQLKKAKDTADRMGKKIYMCSNIVEDPEGIKALIGMGYTDFSMPVSSAEYVRAGISRINYAVMKQVVDALLAENDVKHLTPEQVREKLRSF